MTLPLPEIRTDQTNDKHQTHTPCPVREPWRGLKRHPGPGIGRGQEEEERYVGVRRGRGTVPLAWRKIGRQPVPSMGPTGAIEEMPENYSVNH